MKLIDLLKITAWYSDIIVYEDGEDEDIFTGIAMDVPWEIANRKLSLGLEDGECAIAIRNANDKATMIVSVKNFSEDE